MVICIIPTLNEAATVADVMKKAKKSAQRIVVADGRSNDSTCKIASEARADVLFQEEQGKGMTLRTAFDKIVGGDIFDEIVKKQTERTVRALG